MKWDINSVNDFAVPISSVEIIHYWVVIWAFFFLSLIHLKKIEIISLPFLSLPLPSCPYSNTNNKKMKAYCSNIHTSGFLLYLTYWYNFSESCINLKHSFPIFVLFTYYVFCFVANIPTGAILRIIFSIICMNNLRV